MTVDSELPPEPPSEPPTAPDRRFPLSLAVSGAALVAVLAAAAVWFFVWRGSQTPPSPQAIAPTNSAPAPPIAPAQLTLNQAFALAFPTGATLSHDWQGGPLKVQFAPLGLVPLKDGGVALLSSGTVVDAAHVNSGFLAIHYLAATGGAWGVSHAWPFFAETGSSGAIGGWKRRGDLFANPGVELDGGGMWQGCAVDFAELIELTPNLPTVRAPTILTMYDGSQSAAPNGATKAKIVVVKRGQAFKATYDGDYARTVTWTMSPGGVYLPSAENEGLPGC